MRAAPRRALRPQLCTDRRSPWRVKCGAAEGARGGHGRRHGLGGEGGRRVGRGAVRLFTELLDTADTIGKSVPESNVAVPRLRPGRVDSEGEEVALVGEVGGIEALASDDSEGAAQARALGKLASVDASSIASVPESTSDDRQQVAPQRGWTGRLA